MLLLVFLLRFYRRNLVEQKTVVSMDCGCNERGASRSAVCACREMDVEREGMRITSIFLCDVNDRVESNYVGVPSK